jgi:uncharacterized membrane protein YjjB (DUF3815 family)
MADLNANRQILSAIFLGLAAWGVYLAIGDYLSNHNLLRAATTIACVAVFLGVWLTALAVRRSRETSDHEIESK